MSLINLIFPEFLCLFIKIRIPRLVFRPMRSKKEKFFWGLRFGEKFLRENGRSYRTNFPKLHLSLFHKSSSGIIPKSGEGQVFTRLGCLWRYLLTFNINKLLGTNWRRKFSLHRSIALTSVYLFILVVQDFGSKDFIYVSRVW